MSKKSLFLMIAAMFFGASVNALAGGVTNIKEVLNDTGFKVEVRKYDTKPLAASSEFETTKEIPADGGTWSGDMWIQWADNANDFSEKHLEIVINGRTAFWIWQSGEFVRYNNRARFVSNSRQVFGESKSGGERRLIISLDKDGRAVFEFEKL